MESVTFTLNATCDNTIDLRDDPHDVGLFIADVAWPLLNALGELYAPATLALVLDIAAKMASYSVADASPCPEASLQFRRIVAAQRELLRAAGRRAGFERPLTAEMLW